MELLDRIRRTIKQEGVGHAFGEAILSAAKAALEPDEDRQAEHLDSMASAIRIEFGADGEAEGGGDTPEPEPEPTRRPRRRRTREAKQADKPSTKKKKHGKKGPGTGRRYCAHCGEAKGNRAFEPGHEVCKDCTAAGATEPGEESGETE